MPTSVTVIDVTSLPMTDVTRQRISESGIDAVSILGDAQILQHTFLGLMCSKRCPGSVILNTYDAAKKLREKRFAVAGGFHSPMEQECKRILLRGTQPVIWCVARSMENMRLPIDQRMLVEAGRLLVLSPFNEGNGRITARLAERRNRFIARLCDELFVPYVSPNGQLQRLCVQLLAEEKVIWTLGCHENQQLIQQGARPLKLGRCEP
jgi:hypothetical protein